MQLFKKKEEPPKPTPVDETDVLIAKIERDMGKFPFQQLWPQSEESSLFLKIISTAALIISLITLIVVIAK